MVPGWHTPIHKYILQQQSDTCMSLINAPAQHNKSSAAWWNWQRTAFLSVARSSTQNQVWSTQCTPIFLSLCNIIACITQHTLKTDKIKPPLRNWCSLSNPSQFNPSWGFEEVFTLYLCNDNLTTNRLYCTFFIREGSRNPAQSE